MSSPLSPEDAAAVLRRAAELDTDPLEDPGCLDESVVREAAREVGLSEAAVDQAVIEWRTGALSPLPDLPRRQRLGLDRFVYVEHELDRPPGATLVAVEQWLQSQWFERRRVRGGASDWAPRRGSMAKVRRAVDLQGALRLRDVQRLRVQLSPTADGTQVRLVADLGDLQSGLLAGMVALPALAVAAGTAIAVVSGNPLPEVLLAAPTGAAAGAAGWWGARRVLAGRRERVHEELERAVLALPTARPTGPWTWSSHLRRPRR